MLAYIRLLTRAQKAVIFLALDMVLLPLAMLFTFAIQALPDPAWVTFKASLPVLPYLLLISAGMSLWLGLPNIQLKSFGAHAVKHTVFWATGVMLAFAGLSWIADLGLSAGTHISLGISAFLIVIGSRTLMFQLLNGLYRRAAGRCRVLIYGAGNTGTQLVSAFRTHEGIDPVAFVDDNTSLQGMMLAGLPVFAPARIPELVEAKGIDRVLLAMPSSSQPKQVQIARRLQRMGLEVQSLPSFSQLIGEEALVDKLTPVAPHNFVGREVCDVVMGEASESYQDRVVLVSGAGGSIGSELCRQVLNCRPSKLILYELSELALYTVDQELRQISEGAEIEIVPVLGSVTDPRQVRQVLSDHNVQVVLHAAAYKHVPLVEANPLAGLANNVFGTQTLAREAAEMGVERFILISSDKAVRPTNVMGASKRLAELVVQDLATRSQSTIFTMVRFGNVLGSSGSVVPLFQEQIARGGPVTVTDLRVKRFFMTIREAVQLVLKAGSAAQGGEVFVLDMGMPVPIMQLARQVIESAGYTVRDSANPDGDIEIKITGLRPGEKLEEELTLTGELQPTRYDKVSSVREDLLSEIEVAALLRGLRQALAQSDADEARAVILRWVEGYAPDADRKRS